MRQNKLREVSANTADNMAKQALLPMDCGAQIIVVSNTFFT